MRLRNLYFGAAAVLSLMLVTPGSATAQPEPTPTAPDPTSLVERTETFEVEDPVEATRIADEIAQQAIAEAGPGARAAADTSCVNNRFRSCKTYGARITQISQARPTAPEEIIGIWRVDLTLTVTSQVQNLGSTVSFLGRVVREFGGPLAGTFTMNVGAQKPNNGFGQPIGNPVTFRLDAGVIQTTTFPQVFSPVTLDDNTYNTFLTYDWSNTTPVPQQFPPPGTQITQQSIRCDATPYLQNSTGCVNPKFQPTINFLSSTYPLISRNIQNGQVDGLGVPGVTPLRRGFPADVEANRDAACSTANRNRLGTPDPNIVSPECDEYPFASSLDGGDNASVAWVPRTENQSQATNIREFYRQNRLMTNDEFFVQP